MVGVKDGRDAEVGLAERLLSEALTKVRWREIDLATRPKGHPVKSKDCSATAMANTDEPPMDC